MPIHDWTRVRANRFHHFHQTWLPLLAGALNQGVLPPGYVALAEQITSGPEPDVVALDSLQRGGEDQHIGLALQEAPIRATLQLQAEATTYARKASRIKISHPDGVVIAVMEIVSPGNKDSKHAIRSFVRKSVGFLRAGIHLLIVDLFPPTKRDPQGVHKLIWDHIHEEELTLPAQKPLTLAAYSAGATLRAFVEPVAVGQSLPDMPIFLLPDRYVLAPLEATYTAAWNLFPDLLKTSLVAP
jgi:hypothetical protein